MLCLITVVKSFVERRIQLKALGFGLGECKGRSRGGIIALPQVRKTLDCLQSSHFSEEAEGLQSGSLSIRTGEHFVWIIVFGMVGLRCTSVGLPSVKFIVQQKMRGVFMTMFNCLVIQHIFRNMKMLGKNISGHAVVNMKRSQGQSRSLERKSFTGQVAWVG